MSVASRSPTTRLALDALGRAMLRVDEVPGLGARAATKEALDRALSALGVWARSEPGDEGHLEALERARTSVHAGAEHASEAGSAELARDIEALAGFLAEAREEALSLLVAAQDEALKRAMTDDRREPPAFAASEGVPRLRPFEGGGFRLDLEAPEPPDDDLPVPVPSLEAMAEAADRDDAEEAAEQGGPDATTSLDDADARALAHDALEDVAIHGGLRHGEERDAWTDAAPFEQRLLRNLDALFALAACEHASEPGLDLLGELARYAGESPVPDAGRAFARAFILACVEGDGTARAAVLALRRSSEWVHAPQGDALCLAPHPGIRDALLDLLRSEDPRHVVLALDVLRFRRELTCVDASLLVEHPDPRVVEAAVRGLGFVRERAAAVEAIEAAVDAHDDDALLLAGVEALMRQGAAGGADRIRARLVAELEVEGADADDLVLHGAELLAVGGTAADLAVLLQACRGSARGSRALGWFGHAGAVLPLVAELAAARELPSAEGGGLLREIAAAEALHRITGAPLVSEDDAPAPGAFTTPVSRDPHAWATFWEHDKGRFSPAVRHRFGAPYALGATLDELTRDDTMIGDRRFAAIELAVAIGVTALEPSDWVARQRGVLSALASRAAGGELGVSMGAWPAASPRRGA